MKRTFAALCLALTACTGAVTPSIRVGDGRASWHGFLRHGEWEVCK